jgi:hypothetical protein
MLIEEGVSGGQVFTKIPEKILPNDEQLKAKYGLLQRGMAFRIDSVQW